MPLVASSGDDSMMEAYCPRSPFIGTHDTLDLQT